jgi:hypothetical protein
MKIAKFTLACFLATATYCITTIAADTKESSDISAEKQKIVANIAKAEANLAKRQEFDQKQSKIIAQFKSCVGGAENKDSLNACKTTRQVQLQALARTVKGQVAANNGASKQAATSSKTTKN